MARIGTLAGTAVLAAALAAGCSSHSVVTAPASSPTSGTGSGSTGLPRSAQVGDTLELAGNEKGARIAVTVTAVADPATGADAISTPGAGERLVAVQFRLHNIGSAVYSDAPANSATVIDEQGQGFNTSVTTEVTAGPGFPAGVHVAPGDTALGYLAFEVPAGSRLAKAQFTLNSGFADQTGQWALPAATAAPTATATAARTTTVTATATATAGPRTAAAAPRQAVEDYYAAINARDYARAWALGGRNLAPSYGQFVNGFTGTAADTVTVTAVNGDTVSVLLDALQTDGTHHHYAGTYTVRNGIIVAASIH
ncbi:DUF4352 domain-containing protein [Streptomyces sp. NRRL B-24484]|uniref:DUF4352 domain-containing protein n=1 Tax=Streptomyces sp. NRRL B-24484 TaxID=1463833 RepID=UPI000694CB21|nr:DUF4352 domain-containing protein [Streptomyces sp. NRRL B-24484]